MASTKGEVLELAERLFEAVERRFSSSAPASVSGLREELARLRREASTLPEFAVCFVGNAGVGKSTLINALVDPRIRVLPEGGAGPLTARETRVIAGTTPSLEVEYVTRSEVSTWMDALASSVDSDSDSAARRSRIQHQLQLLVCGNQYRAESDTYLMNACRFALGVPGANPSGLRPADVDRVVRMAKRVRASSYRLSHPQDRTAFLRDVALHTSGALSPLVKHVTIGWDSKALLPGVTLVDLPGLGVAQDAYQESTRRYLHDHARVTVLVVDRAGLVDSVALPLQQAGFFERMLHGLNEHRFHLGSFVVVVLKLDLTASDDWRKDRSLHGRAARPWHEHFKNAQDAAKVLLRNQLRLQLEAAAKSVRDSPLTSAALVERALRSIEVLSLLPTEYQKLESEDADNKARLENGQDTGIPAFAEQLLKAYCGAGGLSQEQFLARVLAFQSRVSSLISDSKRQDRRL
jgi:GTP-binding protein EngB required for normal cell division